MLRIVLRHPIAVSVHYAEAGLCEGHPLIGQGTQESHCSSVIAAMICRYAFTQLVCPSITALTLGRNNLVSRHGAGYGKCEKATG